MACDCDHSKTRKFTRIGGTPPRPIVVAKVTVKSECAPPPAPEEGHFLDPAYHTKFALETPASLETRWEITKSLVRVDPDPGPAPPARDRALRSYALVCNLRIVTKTFTKWIRLPPRTRALIGEQQSTGGYRHGMRLRPLQDSQVHTYRWHSPQANSCCEGNSQVRVRAPTGTGGGPLSRPCLPYEVCARDPGEFRDPMGDHQILSSCRSRSRPSTASPTGSPLHELDNGFFGSGFDCRIAGCRTHSRYRHICTHCRSRQ